MISNTALVATRLTSAAMVGRSSELAPHKGTVYEASLAIDSEAEVPGSVRLLEPGGHYRAVVQLGTEDSDRPAVRSVWLKIPDIYGPGHDQDFLLVSSGDGAPQHHLTLPVTSREPTLYSSLWLYLAGFTPVLFGLRTGAGGLRIGAIAEFSISAPVGKFRRVAALTLAEQMPNAVELDFAARHTGGNIRALPPVYFY